MSESAASMAEILELLDAWAAALYDKDLDALGKCYAADVCVYDINTQLVGFEGLRVLWKSCFPYFSKPIGVERKDIHATVGDDVGTLSFLSRVSGMEESDDPATKSWFRATFCFMKFEDGWKITQEHSSLAIDLVEKKPALILDE